MEETQAQPVATDAKGDDSSSLAGDSRATLRAGLLDLVKKPMNEERTPRRAEVRNAWQQRAFANGIQQMWWDSGSHSYLQMEASGMELPRFRDAYNIYTPHKRSIENLLSQPTMGINFTPDDLQQSNDVTAAAVAEKMRARVDEAISIKDRQSEIAGYFCTDGRVITRVWIDSKGKLRVTVHGVLESKVPLFARKKERWSYCVLGEEIDRYEAMEEYPDFADEIESFAAGTAENNYERLARLNVIGNRKGGGEADSLKSVVTEAHGWLRTSRYRKATPEVAEYLTDFPDGIRITVCGGVVVSTHAESMDDTLTVDWPSPGQGASRPSMMHDVVPVQQTFNDFMNHQREQAEFVDPMTYIAQDAYDEESISQSESAPAGMTILTVKPGDSIASKIYIPDVKVMTPELVAGCQYLQTFSEVVSGDYASLQGDGDPHAETLGGQKLLTNQAKGQLSNAWAAMQRLGAGTYSLAIVKQATIDQDKPTIAVKGQNGQDSFSPAAILNGKWGCYASQDSSFPETMADKRASLQAVLTQLGEADPKLVLHPDNQKLIKQYSGLTDLVIQAADSRDKQLEEIEQMLQEPPIPDVNSPQYPQYQQAMAQWQQQEQAARSQHYAQHVQSGGDPSAYQSPQEPMVQPPQPPLTSSIPIDAVYDFHQFEYDKLQEWLNSRTCREELRKGNQQGVQNIKLHGNLHKAQIDAAAQQNAPKVEPPKVSLTMAVTDPNTISQFAQAAGATATTPQDIANSQIPDQQETAAKTAHISSQAQHVSVLAAKEETEPAYKMAIVQPPKPPIPSNVSAQSSE